MGAISDREPPALAISPRDGRTLPITWGPQLLLWDPQSRLEGQPFATVPEVLLSGSAACLDPEWLGSVAVLPLLLPPPELPRPFDSVDLQ